MCKRNDMFFLLLVAVFFSFQGATEPIVPQLPLFSPDQVLVAFSPGTPSADIRELHQRVGGKVIKTITAIGLDVVKVPAGTVLDKIKLYQRNPNVSYAEPNYLRPLIMPIEGQFSASIKVFDEQWSLHNTGNGLQTYVDPATGASAWGYGFLDSDIDATEAWEVSKGSSDVWVAVIDSGVDCGHPDLAGKCIHNEDHVSAVFDTFGNAIPEFIDQAGHGTHVAGIIAMNTNNAEGGAGVGWDTSIGSFKVCYLEQYIPGYPIGSSCLDADIVAGLTSAADYGYHIINMSFGGGHSSAVQGAIDYASNKGALLVAAAGNSNSWQKLYPAAYPNVISVAATNTFDDRASFSNLSLNEDDWVDVMAPGEPILSTVPRAFCAGTDPQCFKWLRGTSMAAPHVAGIAALVKSYIPSADSNYIRKRIEDCADTVGAMGQNMLVWSKYGRVNAHRALVDPSCDSSAEFTSVHVASLSGAVTNLGKNWRAEVTVFVQDNNNSVVNSATVSGTWSGGTSGSGECSTENNGSCIISSLNMSKKVSSATFTVTNIKYGSNNYPSSQSITIFK